MNTGTNIYFGRKDRDRHKHRENPAANKPLLARKRRDEADSHREAESILTEIPKYERLRDEPLN